MVIQTSDTRLQLELCTGTSGFAASPTPAKLATAANYAWALYLVREQEGMRCVSVLQGSEGSHIVLIRHSMVI